MSNAQERAGARFMVTTPIYYVNAPVHMGHAYTSIACDVLARWRRLRGDEVFFLTGVDEHGGNIEKVAKEAGVSPQAWCDRIAADDRSFFDDYGIAYDDFIRTTEERHARACEAFWQAVAAGNAPDGKPNLSKGVYEALYCSRCEANYAEGELVDGNCPVHGLPVEKLSEETYFFHLAGYQQVLDAFFEAEAAKNPDRRFIVPESRFNEVRGILKEGLRDASVSRTKIAWGFPVPGDPAHVMYVWFDALINYLTALGYPDRTGRRWGFWPADLHVMGKEIIRFHCLLWPAMLRAAGLPLPRKIVVQGWWTVEGQKMSKSLGNVVDPRALAAKYGLDAVRHFLLAEIAYGADGDFSERRFIERYNTDLANVFGNLAHRTISMAFKYFGGKVPRPSGGSPWKDRIAELWPGRVAAIEALAAAESLSFVQAAFVVIGDEALAVPQFQDAITDAWALIKHGNLFIDQQAPWKQPPAEQAATLGHVLELLEAASWPLLAFLPGTAARLRAQLGLSADRRAPLQAEFHLVLGDPLFPRIDTKKKP